ncbi:MAG: hypothetical protein AAF170_00305 [Bacteroidota bacterium]
MNTALVSSPPSSPSWLRLLWRISPPLVVSAAAMGLLALVCLGGLAVDPRMLLGEPIWIKPLKFCISGALYALGLAALIHPLRGRWVGRIIGWGVSLILVAETVLIAMQAVRGVRSHFNISTAFDAAVFSSMGTMIAALSVLTLVAAIAILRQPATDRLWKQATLWALAMALAGGAVGPLMTAPTPEQRASFADARPETVGAHAVGVPDGGPGLPFLGWSTVGGDLRVPHFWGLHGLQVLPLLALGLMRLQSLTNRQRRRLLRLGGLAYAGIFGLLLQQALRAQPLFAPDVLTFALLTGLVLFTGLAGLRVLRSDAPPSPAR